MCVSKAHYEVATVSRLYKTQVSFAEYHLFYRALLQKRPIIQSILLVSKAHYEVATISRLYKTQVSFAENNLFYRALLQKSPII